VFLLSLCGWGNVQVAIWGSVSVSSGLTADMTIADRSNMDTRIVARSRCVGYLVVINGLVLEGIVEARENVTFDRFLCGSVMEGGQTRKREKDKTTSIILRHKLLARLSQLTRNFNGV